MSSKRTCCYRVDWCRIGNSLSSASVQSDTVDCVRIGTLLSGRTIPLIQPRRLTPSSSATRLTASFG